MLQRLMTEHLNESMISFIADVVKMDPTDLRLQAIFLAGMHMCHDANRQSGNYQVGPMMFEQLLSQGSEQLETTINEIHKASKNENE